MHSIFLPFRQRQPSSFHDVRPGKGIWTRFGQLPLVLGLWAIVLFVIPPVNAEVFVVTNRVDGEPGSLRFSIEAANQSPGPDGIVFDLDGDAPYVLLVQSNLPPVTDPVVIDGAFQPGYQGRPLIELVADCPGDATDGLVLLAPGNTVRGLSIGGFCRAGLVLSGEGGNVIVGNYLGVDATGRMARRNHYGILIENGSPFNTIGSIQEGGRNLISGNEVGVAATLFAAGGQVVVGNWIGPDITGNNALGNGVGIAWTNASSSTLGGFLPGAGNLISGNEFDGILVAASSRNVIQGNLVGTEATGRSGLGNGGAGLVVLNSSGNTVGGSDPDRGNIISGNDGPGVVLRGVGSFGNVLQSNLIGLNAAGDDEIPNREAGLIIEAGAGRNTVGATLEEGGAGSASLRSLDGRTPLLGNTISGNDGAGMVVRDEGSDENVIQGNRVGMSLESSQAWPNAGPGIVVSNAAAATLLGGLEPDQGNWIAFNHGDGVLIFGDERVQGHLVSMNSIHDNDGLALNLQVIGESDFNATPNDDLDADVGPNGLQNYPELTDVTQSDGSTLITGILRGSPDQSFQIDLYHQRAARENGLGEGEGYGGFTFVDTDETGQAELQFSLTDPALAGRSFSVTAINLESGDTSEFSPSMRDANAEPVIGVKDMVVVEGPEIVQAVFEVWLSAASDQTVEVKYGTENDVTAAFPAQENGDYTPRTGRLIFAPGQIRQEVIIDILPDEEPEIGETFLLVLSEPVNADLVESQAQGKGIILDLRIQSIALQDSGVAMTIPSVIGVNYRLERAISLGQEALWRPVITMIQVPGTGAPLSLVDETVVGVSRRYYRVRVVTP